MSLQDDYFDVRDTLKDKPEAEQFENIWEVFCREETELLKLRECISKIKCLAPYEDIHEAWNIIAKYEKEEPPSEVCECGEVPYVHDIITNKCHSCGKPIKEVL